MTPKWQGVPGTNATQFSFLWILDVCAECLYAYFDICFTEKIHMQNTCGKEIDASSSRQ